MAGSSADGSSFLLDNTADVFQVRPGFLASFPGGLLGLDGNDLITGSEAGEILYGNRGDDHLSGNDGSDIVAGGQGQDTLYGNQGDDQIFGNKNNDILYGGQGNDQLAGGNGDDILFGDLGTDILTGDLAEDIFVLRSDTAVTDAAAADVISDFGNGFDRIGLTGGLTEAGLVLEATGADTLIRISGSNAILGKVLNVAPAQLAGRFVSAEAAVAGPLGASRDLGVLSGTQTVTDFVESGDTTDIYRFTLNTVGNFTLALNGLSGDVDVDLLKDFNGNRAIDFEDVRDSSTNSGTSPESLNINGLAAGDYYVRVLQFEGDTNYTLSVSATQA